MEVFGLSIDSKEIDRLPSKIWRAVMLLICDLPVTQYLVKDTRITPAYEIIDMLSGMLRESQSGIIVRTVGRVDTKREPYHWVMDLTEVEAVVSKLLQRQRYLMAFAPKTILSKTEGFIVGRYLMDRDGGRTLEFVSDAIQPRKLYEVSRDSEDYGLIRRKAGEHCFHIIKTPVSNDRCGAIVTTILRYEENLAFLWEQVGNTRCICIEFTYHQGALETHDFDYRIKQTAW